MIGGISMGKGDNCQLVFLSGVVQGVGMRPFIYRLAREMGICGWVSNTGGGVRIHAEGDDLDGFVRRVREEKPALAVIDCVVVERSLGLGFQDFSIVASCETETPDVLISPDLAVCADCLREIRDRKDRRFGYAFTNCTNCGPRYTIVRDRPYDRARTTMAAFAMCGDCAGEYHDPEDRRFHAQPVACRCCGPELVFCGSAQAAGTARLRLFGNEALARVGRVLLDGGIVAVKGLGGFHLACDAGNQEAVRLLRRRKERGAKPFAVMAADLALARSVVYMNDLEAAWLTSAAAPIVLLERRRDEPLLLEKSLLADDIAPGLDSLGVMLPYTPLHVLLMQEGFSFLVLTSANLSGQPLIYHNEEAFDKLDGLADGFLLHDREIFHPCDDSVVRQIGGEMTFYRRARGYVPLPLTVGSGFVGSGSESSGSESSGSERSGSESSGFGETRAAVVGTLPESGSGSESAFEAARVDAVEDRVVLAVGADMKNAFCFFQRGQAFLSPYLGEMSDKLSFDRFGQEVGSWGALLHFRPDLIVHDAHPGYATTRWAKARSRESGVEIREAAHHHAHLVSVMGEHGLKEPTLGLVADGTGYGTDGRIWGCEVLWGDARSFVRRAHLQYLPLPSGDAGVRFPLRTAYAYFLWLQPDAGWEDLVVWRRLSEAEKTLLRAQVAEDIRIDLTSSAGRLFDVMAALLGVCYEVTYEAQAAMELENLAWRREWERREERGFAGGNGRDDHDGLTHLEVFSDLWEDAEHNDYRLYPLKRYRQDGEETDIFGLRDFFAALWRDISRAHEAEGADVSRSRDALAWKCHASLAWGLGRYLEQTWTDKRLVLAGGVFQNKLFTEMLEAFLVRKGWTVHRARQLPPGDGGIALGQSLIS
ncbi:MAG: carbamoyltransferase HypF [Peptococcaceae bacterium]|nr:carbamoyltransferase HypF [Peptococcaceae bacterium]